MQNTAVINTPEGMLRGAIHIPTYQTKKMPGVLIFHGFTGNRVGNNAWFVSISRELEKRGIASLRFDFLGSGESDGYFEEMTFSKELEQARMIIQYMQEMDQIDQNKIILLGHSMGGSIAAMMAAEFAALVKALILIAPAGEMVDRLNELEFGDKLKNIDSEEEAYPIDLGGILLGKSFFKDVLNMSVYETAKRYEGEVLLIHGTEDAVVPISVVKEWQNLYSKVETHYIKGADHNFCGYNWREEVNQKIFDFFHKKL